MQLSTSGLTTVYVQVSPPSVGSLGDADVSVALTVYELVGEPLLTPSTQVTIADWFPPVATTPVGAAGTPVVVTLFDLAEAVPVPLALMAATVKV